MQIRIQKEVHIKEKIYIELFNGKINIYNEINLEYHENYTSKISKTIKNGTK